MVNTICPHCGGPVTAENIGPIMDKQIHWVYRTTTHDPTNLLVEMADALTRAPTFQWEGKNDAYLLNYGTARAWLTKVTKLFGGKDG